MGTLQENTLVKILQQQVGSAWTESSSYICELYGLQRGDAHHQPPGEFPQ